MLTTYSEISEEAWIYKYISIDLLEYWFTSTNNLISFSRLDTFNDQLEGLPSPLSVGDIKAVEETKLYQDAVTNEGATGGCLYCSFESFSSLINIADHENQQSKGVKQIDLKTKIESFERFLKNKGQTHVSCFFLGDENNKGESRYMWKLYGSNSKDVPGILIGLKWGEVKEQLNNSDVQFYAGPVHYESYPNKGDTPDILCKDISYKHEREFRIYTKSFDNSLNYIAYNLNKSINTKIIIENMTHTPVFRAISKYLNAEFSPKKPIWKIQKSKLLKEEVFDYKRVKSIIDSYNSSNQK